jgi:hypothetical protein
MKAIATLMLLFGASTALDAKKFGLRQVLA